MLEPICPMIGDALAFGFYKYSWRQRIEMQVVGVLAENTSGKPHEGRLTVAQRLIAGQAAEANCKVP